MPDEYENLLCKEMHNSPMYDRRRPLYYKDMEDLSAIEAPQYSGATLKVTDSINYFLGLNAGLRVVREDEGNTTVNVSIKREPIVIPDEGVAIGIYLDAGYTEYTDFAGETYIDDDAYARIHDGDTGVIVDLPLLPGAFEIDPSQVEQWDELTKQRVIGMLGHLQTVVFSAES